MAERRRIVPDASVMLASFFRESTTLGGQRFDLTRRAQPLALAIRRRSVLAFAPDILQVEFMKAAHRKAAPRDGRPEIDMAEAESQVLDFLRLPITYQPGEKIAAVAWDLLRNSHISPTDCWYVACARFWHAELWLLREQADALYANAREVHGQTYPLTERSFH